MASRHRPRRSIALKFLRRRWPVRVGIWLLMLALVPLAGATRFAMHELNEVSESRSQAETISASTQELVQLTELRARVLDERSWASAEIGIQAIGIDQALVESMAGIDIALQRAAAATAVDASLLELGWSEVQASLAEVRSSPNPDPDTIGADYEEIATAIKSRADQVLHGLLTIGGDISNGSDLVARLRVLESAAVARQALTLDVTSFVGAQLAGTSTSFQELQKLARQEAIHRSAMASLTRDTGPHTEAIIALNALETSDDVISFRAAIASILAEPPAVTEGDSDDVAGILARLDFINVTFQAAAGSIRAHVALLAAASSDVEGASQAVDDAAGAASRLALLRIGVLMAGSLLFVVILARSIGRPLSRLANSAQHLRDGDDVSMLRPSGPREVRQAMQAMNEAAGHFELVERQAHALALGELDNPALTERFAGSIGHSLQDAVQVLTSSVNQSAELRQQLQYEATNDSLTQIANRRASLAQLQRALARTRRTGATLAILFLDLDEFKEVNDMYGHPAGDRVLCTVSERMVEAIREGDIVGRLGGDEFLIIAERVQGAAEAVELAERIACRVAEPMVVGPVTIRVTASVGIALADDTRDLTPDELLRDADLALYSVKGTARSRIRLCDEALREDLIRRSAIEEALGDALVNDELTLYYQPIVDACTARLLSVEALIRWERPGFGLTPPDAFIPIAEQTDLINVIDNWVLRKVVAQLDEWAEDDVLANVPIALNVSGRHLLSDSFVADMIEPVHAGGVDPSRIVLEVTESALLRDLDSAAKKLQLLRDEGITIAIDDFGTGYTSLGHLRTLPVDVLKIDRTFTADETATSLVKLIVDAGHILGARVVAEGIETHEQARHLTELGCDELQGYLYGHAVPPAEIEGRFASASGGICLVAAEE